MNGRLGWLRRIHWALVLPLITTILVVACEKEPGKGGLASVQGKVYGYDQNAFGIVHDSGYAGGFKVYISYGENDWVDGTETTSPTGDYCFKGLQKGLYRVAVYSRCDTCLFNQVYFEQSAEITETKQKAVLPDFVIYK